MTLPPVYPISPDDRPSEALLEWAKALLGAGCTLFQYRRKRMDDASRLRELEALLTLAAPAKATVIVDDRVDLMLLAGAQGVHVGQRDLPPTAVRSFVGRGYFLGFSTHSVAQAEEAFDWPLDYLALGPVFETGSKENPDPVVSPADQGRVLKTCPFPAVAIGGITPERAVELWRRGFASVAVIGALAQEPEKGWKAFQEARARA
jgi:thiamine-phosphate pyrophosphorylase